MTGACRAEGVSELSGGESRGRTRPNHGRARPVVKAGEHPAGAAVANRWESHKRAHPRRGSLATGTLGRRSTGLGSISSGAVTEGLAS